MIYRILADLTVVVHFAYVSFVVFALLITIVGGLRNWAWIRNRWFRGIHLSMIGIVVFEAWCGITCPLTILEKHWRIKSGGQSYQGDFIATWVHDAMFFDLPPWFFTVSYSTFGILVLATIYVWPPRWRNWKRDIQANSGDDVQISYD